MLKYAKVLIVRGPMEKIARTVPLHEIPILRAIHGDSAVQVGETIEGVVPVPEVAAEHARLCAAYGEHPKAGVPYAEYVYGQPLSGGLARALDEANSERVEPAPRRKAAA